MEELEAMGAKVHVIDGDEKTEILKTLEPVRSEWAANLDKNGKPATEIVNAFRKLVDDAATSAWRLRRWARDLPV